MGKKLTYDFVKAKFEEEGYTLISDNYVNSKTTLECVCSNGHNYHTTFNSFDAGYRCGYCAGRAKKTIEEVRESFASEGCTLLSTDYVNAMTKLDYICSNGHKHSIKWNDWRTGYRCSYCYGNTKLTFDEVKVEVGVEGYFLVSEEYINIRSKLIFCCPEGHVFEMTLNNWGEGNRCPVCANISRSIKQSGENNSNWLGGLAYQEYCAVWKDNEYKYSIRERDGHKCLNPYCTIINPKRLHIHHINYNKKDCHFKNLITVCNSCNAKANKDRDWHQSWYQAILMRRYNYKY